MIIEKNMMLDVTKIAKEKIQEKIKKRGKGLGIRIGVRTTGCSGLAYTLEFVDKEDSADSFTEFDNCKVYVNPKHIPYLEGMIVDYVKQGLNEGFEFINPNERAKCGCGESFTV